MTTPPSVEKAYVLRGNPRWPRRPSNLKKHLDIAIWRISWMQIPLGVLGTGVGLVTAVALAVAFHFREDPDDLSLLPLYACSFVVLSLSLGTVASGAVLGKFVPRIVRASSSSGRIGRVIAGLLSAAAIAIATTGIFITLSVLLSGLWGMA